MDLALPRCSAGWKPSPKPRGRRLAGNAMPEPAAPAPQRSLRRDVRSGAFIRRPGVRTATSLSGLMLLTALVGFIVSVLMSRTLGPSGRGEVVFVLQLSYFAWPLFTLGLERWLLRRPAMPASHMASAAYVHLPLLAAIAAVVIFAASHSWVLTLASVVTVSSAGFCIMRGHALGGAGMKLFLRASVLWQICILTCSVLWYALNVTSLAVWLSPYAVPGTLLTVAALGTTIRRPSTVRQGLRLLRRSAPLAFGAVAGTAALRADRLVLPLTSGASQLGLYVGASTTIEMANAIAANRADWLAAYSALEPPASRRAAFRRVGIESMAQLPVIVMAGIFTWFIVIPLLGEPFAASRQYVAPLCLAALSLAAQRFVNSYNLAGEHPQTAIVADIAQGVASVPIYFISTTSYGALGAAWGSLVVYAIGLAAAVAVMGASPIKAHVPPCP